MGKLHVYWTPVVLKNEFSMRRRIIHNVVLKPLSIIFTSIGIKWKMIYLHVSCVIDENILNEKFDQWYTCRGQTQQWIETTFILRSWNSLTFNFRKTWYTPVYKSFATNCDFCSSKTWKDEMIHAFVFCTSTSIFFIHVYQFRSIKPTLIVCYIQ